MAFFDYFPLPAACFYLLAALVGALAGVSAGRVITPGLARSSRRSQLLLTLGLLALVPWVLWPTLQAFPAQASLSARDAWARDHVRYYAALGRVIAALPAVQRDVGPVRAFAPTAQDPHRFAREMDGDDMRFTLDVVGERGRGTFFAVCTLDDYRVYDWQPSTWRFGGREQRVDDVPRRVPER